MIPKVGTARYERDCVIHIGFADGVDGDVDLKDELYGELFEPLKNTSVFEQVTIHPEFHTLCWPNGADLASEFLELTTGSAIREQGKRFHTSCFGATIHP